jgi:hypothetical protein
MIRSPRRLSAVLSLSVALLVSTYVGAGRPEMGGAGPLDTRFERAATGQGLPDRLSDLDFWRLTSEVSEPSGYFQSDNLVSNERPFQYVVPVLQRQKGRGAYLGVAPDQNFTYIIALEPKMAFIVDIRRGNLQEHLMYKALLELSADRADFYARLFSKKRPDGLGSMSSAQEIVAAYGAVQSSELLYKENLKAIADHLTRKHGFPLTDDDLAGIDFVYQQFFRFGPAITYQSSNSGGFGRGNMPSYAELQMSTDAAGQNHSYLANEENYRTLRNFQLKNLVVPVVGDFAGPRALRAVGQYLTDRGTIVTAFYVSNVEQYLFQNGVWQNFYKTAATLPTDEASVFIRSIGGTTVLDPIRAMVRDVNDGKVQSYTDVRARINR